MGAAGGVFICRRQPGRLLAQAAGAARVSAAAHGARQLAAALPDTLAGPYWQQAAQAAALLPRASARPRCRLASRPPPLPLLCAGPSTSKKASRDEFAFSSADSADEDGGGGAGARGGGEAGRAGRMVAVQLLAYGRLLGAVTQRTRVLRLITAMLQAYAWCAGFLASMSSSVPPVLAVLAVQLAILVGALLLGDASRGATRQAAEAELQAALPARLRNLSLFSAVPGLQEALAALGGYRQLVQAVSDDVSAYLFACILLVYTHHTIGL